VSGGADRAIRVTTAAAVVGVAGIAAYVSYQHAFEVVRAHGESGLTARLEPATIDGLVYSSSMVVLYAARHRLPVPALARWLLALGILATLAANVAHGWPGGPVGAAVAAWPAASLVGSYELLLWLIRTSARASMGDVVAGRAGAPADHPVTGLHSLPVLDMGRAAGTRTPGVGAISTAVSHTSGPDGSGADQPHRSADRQAPDRSAAGSSYPVGQSENEVNAAAVAAYRASLESGQPLSERKLAALYGKTSRRWARNRIAEARRVPASAMAEP
jgi:Protein of unknown function (DUF2637)